MMIVPLLLACVTLLENSDRLEVYVSDNPIIARGDANRPLIGEDGRPVAEERRIEVSCEVFPQTLTVGDKLYVKFSTKNISQETLECFPFRGTLGADPSVGRFINSPVLLYTRICENSSRGLNLSPREEWEELQIYPGIPPEQLAGLGGGYIPIRRLRIKTILPADTLISGPQSFFLPFPGEYGRQFWADLSTETIMLLSFSTTLDGRVPSKTRLITLGKVHVYPELKIRPRSEAEFHLIKAWYDKTERFENIWSADSPKSCEWREFEEKLTPGTLRNYARMLHSLVEIAQDKNKGKRQEQFNGMLKWIDELHPLEKEALTEQAYEIVKKRKGLRDEIATPPAAGD